MKALSIGIAVILLLLLGVVFVAPGLVPSETYRTRIQEQLSTELGREVELTGEVRLSTFPLIKARTEGVRIANPPGFSEPDLARLDGLDARIKLLPLLSKRVEISRFTLRAPTVVLERRADGTVNWTFESDNATNDVASDDTPPGPFKRDGRYTDLDPSIRAFNVENGTLRYLDRMNGVDVAVDQVTAFLSLPGLDETLLVDGTARMDGTPVVIDLALDSPDVFLRGQEATLSGSLGGAGSTLKLDGVIPAGEDAAYRGSVDAKLTDPAALTALLKDRAPAASAYLDAIRTATVDGEVDYARDQFALRDGTLTVAGPAGSASFVGEARYDGAPSLQGKIKADVQDMAALDRLLGDSAPTAKPYLQALRSASLDGELNVDGQRYALRNGTVSVAGPAGTAGFDGSGSFKDGAPQLDGQIKADIRDAQALRPLLPEPVAGFEMLRTATLDATLKADGPNAFAIANAVASATGDGVSGRFEGSGRYDDALALAGDFNVEAADPARLARAVAPDVKGVAILGATTAKGRLRLSGTDLRVTGLTARTEGETLTASFSGDVARQGETVSATGAFDAALPDLSRALQLAAIEIDPAALANAKAAGAVDATGRIAYDGATATVSDLVATSRSAAQTSTYRGRLRYDKIASLDGSFDSVVPSLSALNALLPAELPYHDAVSRIAANGRIAGEIGSLTVSDLSAEMTDGLLNGRFTGSARQDGKVIGLNGSLDAGGDSLRALAGRTGTQLPPSSAAGSVFERFGLSGTVSGSTDALALSDATLRLDALKGTGAFALNMAGARPSLTGDLDVGVLDLRPYMAAYSARNETGAIQPWSTEPLPVDGLRAVDADLDIQASQIKLSRLSLGATQADVTLRGGVLRADMPRTSLYGGAGRATLMLDGSGAVPQVEITAGLDKLDGQGFLGAVAGFAKASGTAGTQVSLRGSGRSQAEIMQSLSGAGDFKLVDGAIQGIDAGEFLTGLDSALRSRALPGGIGAGKITKFRDLLGAFKIDGGVATIDRFALDAVGVRAEGEGRVDLGRQTLDFRFRPKQVGDNARGLAAFGIPLRFSGGFGTAKAGLDTEFLGEIVAAKARAEAGRAVSDRIGGPVGDILGGVINGGTGPAPATDPSTGSPPPASTSPNPIDAVLGGLLGGKQGTQPANPQPAPPQPASPQPKPQPQPPAPQPSQPEPQPQPQPETVEDAVLGLFGIKSKPREKKPAPADE